MPSCHVCSRFVFPALPQFPNQEPPRPQQLSLPDFLMMPHVRHTGLMDIVVVPGVDMLGGGPNSRHESMTKVTTCYSTMNQHVCTIAAIGLTFTGIHTVKPTMTHIYVASTSTITIPSTTRSAAADAPRFLERAALGAYCDRRCDIDRRNNCCVRHLPPC